MCNIYIKITITKTTKYRSMIYIQCLYIINSVKMDMYENINIVYTVLL